jgi:hypothetical protein
MDIQSAISITQLTTPLAVKSEQLNLSRLFIGQILNASVVDKKSPESFILQIGNKQIEAKTAQSKPLNVGDQLKLIVEKQDNPITLRVMQHDQKVVTYEAKQQLLRESIPKQAGLEKLTTVLSQASKNVKDVFKNLPLPIEQQFKKLIEQLPVKSSLNNEAGLKTAIKNSGIFLEAKLLTDAGSKDKSKFGALLRTTNLVPQKTSAQLLNQASIQPLLQTLHLDISKDLKTNLLQLSDVLSKYKQEHQKHVSDAVLMKQSQLASIEVANKNTKDTAAKAVELSLKAETDELSKHIESSIARIEVNQSKAIVTHDNQSPLWSIEMPVKDKQDIDLLKLNIQSDIESKDENEREQVWTTDLKITFENIGTISAKLSIIHQEVNASLWSDNAMLNNLIDKNLSILYKKIETCGLATGKIVCLKEIPIVQETSPSGKNLINITI